VRLMPAVVELCLACTAAVWFILELRQFRNVRAEARRADQGSIFVVRLTAAAGFIAAAAVARAAPHAAIGAVDVIAWIGLGLLWAGIALRLWCFRTLGRYFTFTVQTTTDQPAITSGPYRVLCRPAYAGLLLALIGVGILATRNWLSLLVLVPAVVSGLL
jgi:protein-S-isoprenylcysteine O-methyltransferase Ste14